MKNRTPYSFHSLAWHVLGLALMIVAVCSVGFAQGVSVTAHGAKGDGIHDDTDAFEAALKAPAKSVLVPAGTYVISRRLEVPATVSVQGVGAASVLRPQGLETVFVLGHSTRIDSLRIDGSKVKKGGFNDDGLLLATKAADLDFSRLDFTGVDRVCIMLKDCERVGIRDSHFNKVGMAVHAIYSSRVTIQDNTILDARLHGIEIWGCWRTGKRPDLKWVKRNSEDIIVTGNYVKNGGAGAIWGTGMTRAIFANNIVDGAEDVGLDLEWSQDSVIANNTVRNCKNGGVALFFSCENISITGNTIINDHVISGKAREAVWWVRSGIWLTYPNPVDFPGELGHRNISIVGNTIHGAEGERRAIWIGSKSHNILIQANSISGEGKIVGGGFHGINPMQLVELDQQESPLNVEGSSK